VELSVDQIKRVVEASLLMNREPTSAKKIAELFTPEENINERAIIDVLTLLAEDYRGRGIELVEVASGYRFQVCADLAPWIQRTMTEKPQRYSRALLETLALITYRQPITRAEIEEIRGVVVSTQIMRTLEEREWVRVIGHRDVPGRPALYATTKQFLNDLNLKSLGELPTLAELQDLDKIDGEFQQLNLDISNSQDDIAQQEGLEAASADAESTDAAPRESSRSAQEQNNELIDEAPLSEGSSEGTDIDLIERAQSDKLRNVSLTSEGDNEDEEAIEDESNEMAADKSINEVIDEDLLSEENDEDISGESLEEDDESELSSESHISQREYEDEDEDDAEEENDEVEDDDEEDLRSELTEESDNDELTNDDFLSEDDEEEEGEDEDDETDDDARDKGHHEIFGEALLTEESAKAISIELTESDAADAQTLYENLFAEEEQSEDSVSELADQDDAEDHEINQEATPKMHQHEFRQHHHPAAELDEIDNGLELTETESA
jgi:segregation and condensation protein B